MTDNPHFTLTFQQVPDTRTHRRTLIMMAFASLILAVLSFHANVTFLCFIAGMGFMYAARSLMLLDYEAFLDTVAAMDEWELNEMRQELDECQHSLSITGGHGVN